MMNEINRANADWCTSQLQTATSAAERERTTSETRKVRLWPAGVVLVGQMIALGLSVTPAIDNPTRFLYMMLGPAVCGLLFVLWLLLASRLRWRERFLDFGAAVLFAISAALLGDASMGVSIWIYGVPLTMMVITLGLFLGRAWRMLPRTALVTVLLLAVWLPFGLARLEGFTGYYLPELSWRWSPSGEPALGSTPPVGEREKWEFTDAEWPIFRGPRGDSRVVNFGTELNWLNAPPTERWRIPIGPAWSSFAYVSGRLFTQEQRGEQELVTCYDADSGAMIWHFALQDRFSEIVSGAGPRATPTFADGRLYAYSAKGVLSCLDATSGQRLWQHDLMKEVSAPLPIWGFSTSPLVAGAVVIVYAGGDGDNGLMAFHKTTGAPAWQIASHGMNYSSPLLVDFSDRKFVLFGDNTGLMALEPATGERLWNYKPKNWRGPAICQPQQIDETSLIVPLGDGVGLARLEVRYDSKKWNVREKWSSKKLRPSFNDFVYYKNHCYGFDQNIFCCIDAETGNRQWKDGRYGFGQVILLSPAGQLIVATESGEAVLVAADPKQHRELGRVRLFEGKTWNHPVAAGNRLFMRNGKEAVCLELTNRAH